MNISVFASGSGTNAINLIEHFRNSDSVRVVAVFCNNANAGVIEKAARKKVQVVLFTKQDLYETDFVSNALKEYNTDIIALAGFLWLFPEKLVHEYTGRVVNIHPALLPAYGGKGMYGDHVHKAVLANKEKKHGVTVHLVNEEFDKGKIILQESFELTDADNLDSVKEKIHAIEYKIYPEAISLLLKDIRNH